MNILLGIQNVSTVWFKSNFRKEKKKETVTFVFVNMA